MRLGLILIPLMLAVASCTHITKVEPIPQDIGKSYKVTPTSSWNGLRRESFGSVSERWTKDGLLLNGINFWHDIAEETALYKKSEVEFAKFKSDMKATEILEFFVTSKSQSGAEDVEAMNLRPASFGGADGFRFDVTFASTEGLKMRGKVLAAIIDGKLQLIEYWATDAHYFEQDADEAEKIFESIQLI